MYRLAPVRGKAGQPSVPVALNPDGASSIGIKIGRRSLDMLPVDFAAQVRERSALHYAFADADTLFPEIDARLKRLRRALEPVLRGRLHGIGVAPPLSLGGWRERLGVPPELATKREAVDIRGRFTAMSDLTVGFVKDTAAACVAELVAGRGRSMPSFLYLFVDTFIGGGLVIDSHLRAGLHGNAGAAGSVPLGLNRTDAARPPAQLLSVASLFTLEDRLRRAGLDIEAATDARALQAPWQPHTRAWLQESGPAIALAINSAACLLDLEGVIVGASFHPVLRQALLDERARALDCYDWQGVARPALLAGTIGSDARAVGGALLPPYANFAPDQDLFLKLGV